MRKYIAEIVVKFENRDLEKIRQMYDEFVQKISELKCSIKSLTPPRIDEEDREEIENIRGNLITLFFDYNYSFEDIQDLLTKIQNTIDDDIKEVIKDRDTDLAMMVWKERGLK